MDGRRPHELRSLKLTLSPHTVSGASLLSTSASAMGRPDGSATVDQGLSRVNASIYGPREPTRASRAPTVRSDRATIHVELMLAPWSSIERRQRARGDRYVMRPVSTDRRRLVELANAIRSTFEPVVLTHLFPRSEINIVISVQQQDGGLWCYDAALTPGVLPTAINACTLALMDAGIPMKDYVTALTCGLHGTTALLDLNSAEESDLPFLTMAVLPRSGKVPLLMLDTRVHVDRFENMVGIAVEAAKVLRDEMDDAVRARTSRLVHAMASKPDASRDAMDDVEA